ncbi:hypothetical protein [Pseudomonas sp. G(2018)]|uniref:hypothetical protein n=1 Tax=Pseudomonas sp. G(2018) TaxID=2502242 RepID=UPI0010F6E599|nr:hypothetical protein [Pseudomonas sp. G(2018)]
MNNVGVAVWRPLNTWLTALWLFFDQAILRVLRPVLSTIFLGVKRLQTGVGKPVDKSVVKLWKDSAEGRGYWLAATVGLTGWSRK